MAYPLLRIFVFPFVFRHIEAVEGIENLPTKGPYIVAANHMSYIEPSLLAALVSRKTNQRAYSLTKQSIWKVYRRFGIADWMGLIPVDPMNRRACLEIAEQLLRQGFPVLIFPEARRNDEQQLARAKTGVAELALRTRVPVFPLGYRGPEGRTTRQSLKNFLFHGKEIRIRVGKPLVFPQSSGEFQYEQLRTAADVIMRAIAPLCGKPYPY